MQHHVDSAALETIEQSSSVDSLNDLPPVEQIQTSISKQNLRKAAGDIFRIGDEHTGY